MKYKLSFVTFCKIIFVSLALGGCAGPETSRPPGKDYGFSQLSMLEFFVFRKTETCETK